LQQAVTVGSLVMSGSSAAITNSTGTSSLVVSGTSTLAGNVTTSGLQTYTGAVTLAANSALTGVDISFNSTIKSNGSNYSLSVTDTGTTTFAGAIGSSTAGQKLSSLSTDGTGAVAMNAGSVTTTGTQTYTGALTLGANTSLIGSTVTTNSTLAGGSHTLAVSGNLVTADNYSGLTSLTVSGTSSLGGNVTTSGLQTYSGAMTLIGAHRTLTSTANGDLTFAAVDGLFNLTLANGSGAITLGAIGANAALTELTLTGTGLNTLNGDINTSGAIDLKGTSRTTTFDLVDRIITSTANSGNGAITLGTTNAAYKLTLNSGSGTITLSGVGVAGDGMSPTTLAGLILTGTGSNVLGGSINAFGAVD
jgi:hypothetical protein